MVLLFATGNVILAAISVSCIVAIAAWHLLGTKTRH